MTSKEQRHKATCADIPAVVYDQKGQALDFVQVEFTFLSKYLSHNNIRALDGGFVDHHNECHNGAIAAAGEDKILGSTHASELASIQIPKGALMCEGGHAEEYEAVMRVSQPYSMVTAAQRTAAQALGAVQEENRETSR